MKDSISKNLVPLLSKVKGKKPVIIVATVIVAIVGYLAVQKGYISQTVVNNFISSGKIDSIFTMPATDIIK